jgi:hypothetical protein
MLTHFLPARVRCRESHSQYNLNPALDENKRLVFVDNLNDARPSELRSPGDATEADPNDFRGDLGTQ